MRSLARMAQRFIQVICKLFMLRAHASGPISRRQEAELKAFMAADPPIWGHKKTASR